MPATDIRTAIEERNKARRKASWWEVLKQTATEWADDDAMTWAAAVSCYTLLALAPMLVIAVKLAAVHYGPAQASNRIQNLSVHWMGRSSGDAIKEILTRTQQQGGGFFAAVVSSALIVISVGGVFAELQQAMNRIWKVKPKPGRAIWNFAKARMKSVVILAIAAILILVSVFVAATLDKFTESLGIGWKFVPYAIDLPVSVGVLTLIFGLVYKTVPDAEIGWGTTVMGALISAALFQIGRYGLALYFKFAAPTSAFGAVGSLAAILIWIYYSAQIVFFGAEFTQVYAKLRGHGVRPSRHAQFLSECDETETPVPSKADPGDKPPRPDRGPKSPSPYDEVLGQYVPRGARAAPSNGVPAHSQRDYLLAGIGVVAGALLGGLGAVKFDRRANPRQADASLAKRVDGVRRKLRRVSKVKQYLARPDVGQKIDELERQVIATAERAKRRARARATS